MLCHNSIISAFTDLELQDYLRTKLLPYTEISDSIVLGNTGYMELMSHKHLTADVCVGKYGERHFLAIKVSIYRWWSDAYLPGVIVIFQRYDGSNLIVNNGMPDTVVNNSSTDTSIVKELLLNAKTNVCSDYGIRPYNRIPSKLQPRIGFHDIMITTEE